MFIFLRVEGNKFLKLLYGDVMRGKKKWWVWRHNVKVGKWTYQAGPQDSLLVWTALVSPWMCAQQTLSGNFRRNRIRSDSLVSMAKSEHHKAGIKQDGLWSKGLTLRVHDRMREFTTRWDPNKSNSFYSSYFSEIFINSELNESKREWQTNESNRVNSPQPFLVHSPSCLILTLQAWK